MYFSVMLLFISKLFTPSIGGISRSTWCSFALSNLIKLMPLVYLRLLFILCTSLLIIQPMADQRIRCLLSRSPV